MTIELQRYVRRYIELKWSFVKVKAREMDVARCSMHIVAHLACSFPRSLFALPDACALDFIIDCTRGSYHLRAVK